MPLNSAGMFFIKQLPQETHWDNKMAQTIEDVLARRLLILFLDANAAKKAAPGVAKIIADELNWTLEKKKNS